MQFVKVPDAGVPRAGVTSVGDVARTTLPLPVVPNKSAAETRPVAVKDVVTVRLLSDGLCAIAKVEPVPVCDAIEVALPDEVIGPVRF